MGFTVFMVLTTLITLADVGTRTATLTIRATAFIHIRSTGTALPFTNLGNKTT
jgi:hypothetical protein